MTSLGMQASNQSIDPVCMSEEAPEGMRNSELKNTKLCVRARSLQLGPCSIRDPPTIDNPA